MLLYMWRVSSCLRNSLSTFVGVFTIKRPKGAGAARAYGVLMETILTKCILSSLVYNLLYR